jgi:hypothetical protein
MRILEPLAIGLLALPAITEAQSLAGRISRAPDGEVRVAFAARDGLCGDGETFIRDRTRDNYVMMRNWSSNDRSWRNRPCDEGPVRVALKVRGGLVRSAQVYVGGGWNNRAAGTDLGLIGTGAALTAFVELARKSGSSSDDVLFPLTLADSIVVWPAFLALARDKSAPRSTRKQAVFWVSQAAGEKTAEGLSDLATDETEDREVREQAVFALSQLPEERGVPVLIRVATGNRDREIRKKAMFWLGQSDDPRALALFEDILTKPQR